MHFSDKGPTHYFWGPVIPKSDDHVGMIGECRSSYLDPEALSVLFLMLSLVMWMVASPWSRDSRAFRILRDKSPLVVDAGISRCRYIKKWLIG